MMKGVKHKNPDDMQLSECAAPRHVIAFKACKTWKRRARRTRQDHRSGGQRAVVGISKCESSSAGSRAAEAVQRGERWFQRSGSEARRAQEQLPSTALQTMREVTPARRRDLRFVRGCGSGRSRGWAQQDQAFLPSGRNRQASIRRWPSLPRCSLRLWPNLGTRKPQPPSGRTKSLRSGVGRGYGGASVSSIGPVSLRGMPRGRILTILERKQEDIAVADEFRVRQVINP